MTTIIPADRRDFSIDPAILDLLPTQGSVELQRDAAGKVHHYHTHPVDEILLIISGRLVFKWEEGERICGAGDTILLPAGTLHQSEALEGGAIYAIATRPPVAVTARG
jgi:quercetin dioxygenase-like cupin family protein